MVCNGLLRGIASRCYTHRITNTQPTPVYLDQIVLSYWFQGPFDAGSGGDAADAGANNAANAANVANAANDTSSSSNNGGGGNAAGGVAEVVARVSASQFRLTCSDATTVVGEWA